MIYKKAGFSRLAKWTAHAVGHPLAFTAALGVIVVWAMLGPVLNFSDTWQLVINTSTTIVTFLVVFLLQNTQNRESAAIQLKLDELIRAMNGAHNALLDLEELTEDELERIRASYGSLAQHARAAIASGVGDTDTPDVDDR